MKKVLIIAEAGVNHNGDVGVALRLCDAAHEARADAVKFQTFKTENIVTRNAKSAPYQMSAMGQATCQYEMLKALELSFDDFLSVKRHCDSLGIRFLSTPDDGESLEFLMSIGVQFIKIGSGEVDNIPFLRKCGGFGKEIILSTGISSLGEVETAIEALTAAGVTREQITLLHCTTEYPAPLADVNLRAMVTLKNAFHMNVGYSDHTEGIEVAVAAAALGASVIEKHLTLDRRMDGPDHRSSIEPAELKTMIRYIRNIEMALGDGIKRASGEELKNRDIIRKRMIASRNIKMGEILSEENIAIKRSPSGISPKYWDLVVGRKAKKAYTRDEPIEL